MGSPGEICIGICIPFSCGWFRLDHLFSSIPERRPGIEGEQSRTCSPQVLGSNALPLSFDSLSANGKNPYVPHPVIQQMFIELLV